MLQKVLLKHFSKMKLTFFAIMLQTKVAKNPEKFRVCFKAKCCKVFWIQRTVANTKYCTKKTGIKYDLNGK